MPILLPAEPWKATGRWDLYGETLFRLKDRHEREMLLGPTQEEVVAELVARRSPVVPGPPVNLYQVEWKYRDEFRPRFGLLRGREFLMKDAYTFDRDEEGMAASYDVMLQAYRRVFDRCGLSYIVVEAEPGQIGGGVNHEFMARADVGEDLFVECVNGDYLADWKAATPRPPEPASADGSAPLEKVRHAGRGDDRRGLEAARRAGRTDAEDDAVRRGRRDRRGPAARATARWRRPRSSGCCSRRRSAGSRTPTSRREGSRRATSGPQGLAEDVTILADHSVRGGGDWVTGANEAEHHVTGANVAARLPRRPVRGRRRPARR